MLTGWLRRLFRNSPSKRNATGQQCKPRLESLEDRTVPVMNITGNANATALVQALIGKGVTFSNVSFVGDSKAGEESAGTFTSTTNGTQDVGFGTGIILSSGAAKGAAGPNSSGGNTTGFSTSGKGDTDLDAIVAPNNTTDTTILEFDFIPKGNTLHFNYSFGSEEYNEFVNAGFNDVFAFFLNKQNVALLPGTTTAVSIDNVNNGKNSQFYIDNTVKPTPRPDTQMDGLTKVLSVTAKVTAGQVNHIKLAIADVGDTILDSNVFIQTGSFSTQAPPAKAEPVLFRPYRFIYRPATGLYYGIFNVINIGTKDATGAFQLEFSKTPKGVTVANAQGVDPDTHKPFITLGTGVLPAKKAVRVGVVFRNPLHVPISTFFRGNNLIMQVLNTDT